MPAFSKRDDAVSPVIAAILMVAITVVLAATVYVWVSGFSAQGEQAGNLALSQSMNLITADASAAASCTTGATWCAKWTISSASASFRGTDLRVTDATTNVGTIICLQNGAALTDAPLSAGDTLACYGTGADPAVGDKINFIDVPAGTVVATLMLR